MTIRPVRETDRSSWERMRDALWPSEPGEHAREIELYFAGALHEPVEVLLACDEQGEALGFIELSIRAYAEGCVTDRVAYIEGWYVEPKMQRKGVGAALVAAAEAWARSKGCVELGSDTEVANEASAKAHHALGFSETGTIRCFRKAL
jgi:aminoglycoside 6'-N-acetyltransferase I